MGATLTQITQLPCYFSTMVDVSWHLIIGWLYAKFFQKSYFFNLTSGRIWFSKLQRLILPFFKQKSLLFLVVSLIFLQYATPVSAGGGQVVGVPLPIPYVMPHAMAPPLEQQFGVPWVIPQPPPGPYAIAHHVPMPAPPPNNLPLPVPIMWPHPGPLALQVPAAIPMPAPGPVPFPIAQVIPMPAPAPVPVPVAAPQVLPIPFPGAPSNPLLLPIGKNLTPGFLTFATMTSVGSLAFAGCCAVVAGGFVAYACEKNRSRMRTQELWYLRKRTATIMRRKMKKIKAYNARTMADYSSTSGRESGSEFVEYGPPSLTTSEEDLASSKGEQKLDVQATNETTDSKPLPPRPYVPPAPKKLKKRSSSEAKKSKKESPKKAKKLKKKNPNKVKKSKKKSPKKVKSKSHPPSKSATVNSKKLDLKPSPKKVEKKKSPEKIEQRIEQKTEEKREEPPPIQPKLKSEELPPVEPKSSLPEVSAGLGQPEIEQKAVEKKSREENGKQSTEERNEKKEIPSTSSPETTEEPKKEEKEPDKTTDSLPSVKPSIEDVSQTTTEIEKKVEKATEPKKEEKPKDEPKTLLPLPPKAPPPKVSSTTNPVAPPKVQRQIEAEPPLRRYVPPPLEKIKEQQSRMTKPPPPPFRFASAHREFLDSKTPSYSSRSEISPKSTVIRPPSTALPSYFQSVLPIGNHPMDKFAPKAVRYASSPVPKVVTPKPAEPGKQPKTPVSQISGKQPKAVSQISSISTGSQQQPKGLAPLYGKPPEPRPPPPGTNKKPPM